MGSPYSDGVFMSSVSFSMLVLSSFLRTRIHPFLFVSTFVLRVFLALIGGGKVNSWAMCLLVISFTYGETPEVTTLDIGHFHIESLIK
jgi:hypothetical protein